MDQDITPIGERVLIKPDSKEKVTHSGIILADTVETDQKLFGTVLAVGNGEKVNAVLKVGDRVVYEKWAGANLEDENKEIIKIVDFDKVLAIVNK